MFSHLPCESRTPTSVPISGPRRVQAASLWAFYLQGHQVGLSVGVVESPPRQQPPSAWGTRRVAQGLEFIHPSFVCAVQPWVAGSLVAMTKPVPRDSKMKGP